jgi:uncharacterized membrane protein HdeD (DUF308 family)
MRQAEPLNHAETLMSDFRIEVRDVDGAPLTLDCRAIALRGLFAVYMLFDGVFAIVSAIRAVRRHEHWSFLAFEGALVLTWIAAYALFFAPR